MIIRLYVGGARSGKSRLAAERAEAAGGEDVSFVATGRATDAEMARRIEKHRADRPASWETLESDGDASEALRRASHETVLLDCLTFVVADALTQGPAAEELALERCRTAIENLVSTAEALEGELIVVTNEVGTGVVPATDLGRWFRDAQGWANQRLAEAATEVTWVVAGIGMTIKPPQRHLTHATE